MTNREGASLPAHVLNEAQRELYSADGYLLLPGHINGDWQSRLRAAIAETIEQSRSMTESTEDIWLEQGHSAAEPRLLRLNRPDIHHPNFWAFATESPLPDIAADLLGPDVRFSHSLFNFKWAGIGQAVKWHQDIPFYPHTNYAVLSLSTFLEDIGPDQGPVRVVRGSHRKQIYSHYAEDGAWAACLRERDLADLDVDNAPELMGPAGTVTAHSARLVHASAANRSDRGRPILVNVYTAADALPYSNLAQRSANTGTIVRGKPAVYSRLDPEPCPLPPDFSAGFTAENATFGDDSPDN